MVKGIYGSGSAEVWSKQTTVWNYLEFFNQLYGPLQRHKPRRGLDQIYFCKNRRFTHAWLFFRCHKLSPLSFHRLSFWIYQKGLYGSEHPFLSSPPSNNLNNKPGVQPVFINMCIGYINGNWFITKIRDFINFHLDLFQWDINYTVATGFGFLSGFIGAGTLLIYFIALLVCGIITVLKFFSLYI